MMQEASGYYTRTISVEAAVALAIFEQILCINCIQLIK